jgi:copper chaperone CopZ
MNQNHKIIIALSTFLVALFITVQADSTTVQRSNFIVGNLACSSCLATIEAELKIVPGTLGMEADLQAGRITVDHLSTLSCEQIANRISNLGYPATIDWTATVPEQYLKKFPPQNRLTTNCSSGGCSGTSGGEAGLATWNTAPASGVVSRTTLRVNNLTCTSCLANIAAELSQIPETYGMKGYLSRGVVIVDHSASLDNRRIAAVISKLGYSARIVALNEVPARKAYAAGFSNTVSDKATAGGSSCNSRGACNATAASWQELYRRYFSSRNSKE